MPGKMAYLRYTANNGNHYSIRTRARYLGALDTTVAGVTMLGFGAYDPADEPLPRGMKPRGIYVQDPSGGATRFVPVGSLTCPAWVGPEKTLQVDYSGIGTLTDANIIGFRDEKRGLQPHVITNVSDAS